MAKNKNSASVSALLYIIVGALLIVYRSQTLSWVILAAGALFVLFGVIDLIRGSWGSGAVSLIIGIATLVLGWTAAQIVLLVLGILIAVKGLLALFAALNRSKKSLLAILFALLSIVVGLMLAFGNGVDMIILVTGILLVVDGVLGLLGARK